MSFFAILWTIIKILLALALIAFVAFNVWYLLL